MNGPSPLAIRSLSPCVRIARDVEHPNLYTSLMSSWQMQSLSPRWGPLTSLWFSFLALLRRQSFFIFKSEHEKVFKCAIEDKITFCQCRGPHRTSSSGAQMRRTPARNTNSWSYIPTEDVAVRLDSVHCSGVEFEEETHGWLVFSPLLARATYRTNMLVDAAYMY